MGKIIVGNWKMLLGKAEACELGASLSNHPPPHTVKAIVCPSFPLLVPIHNLLDGSDYKIGAQDCSPFSSGAYTGDVGPSVLKEVGCSYVIIGHSERRLLHNESNTIVQHKAQEALNVGLIPIICIGESEEVNTAGDTVLFLKKQLNASCPKTSSPYVVAYEPIWAIGTGRTPSLEDIDHIHSSLKDALPEGTPLLYGGSVTPSNAPSILNLSTVDGVLVGGASTRIDSFKDILNATL